MGSEYGSGGDQLGSYYSIKARVDGGLDQGEAVEVMRGG